MVPSHRVRKPKRIVRRGAAMNVPDSPAAGAAVAVVLKGYPRLSETFIAHEIRALEQRGLRLVLFSLRHPTDRERHPVHEEIRATVTYLPEYLYQEPLRVWRAWRRARRLPGYPAAAKAWWRDLMRDRTPNRVRRFGQALVLAAELPPQVVHLHAHFLHTPASVTRYAAILRGLPWSCSAHAKDVWTTPEWEKREKLAHCAWATTCTAANAQHLRALAPQPDRVDLVYHGVDPVRFPSPRQERRERDGSDPADPVVVLSVGRAVEKKGFDDLLEALAGLPASLNWRLVHVGGGPLLDRLRRRALALGIEARVSWLGALAQTALLERYREADLFVLPSRIARDGDRDGLPNVLLEAQTQGLACVSTRVSGIPELIRDGVTGVLVPERDPPALARALGQLIAEPSLRARLGRAGQARTAREFSMDQGADRLAARFAACLAAR
jgi:glycosyltransferase involved in cell wall biosynthesis